MTEKFVAYDNGEAVSIGVENGTLGGDTIAILWHHEQRNATDAGYHIATARAHKLAACGDLLEACETALLAVHANQSAVDPAIRTEAETKLRAAIAKARR